MSPPETEAAVFQCQQCGECCQGQGGIFPAPGEIELIAQYLNIPKTELIEKYLESRPLGLAIKNKPFGGCVFNERGRCGIHPVKPRICRDWPFLPAILLHETEYEAAKDACPGLNPTCRHEEFLEWWREKII